MTINWKVRFKNPVFVTSLCAFIITTVYEFLGRFDVVPAITQDVVTNTIMSLIKILELAGVFVDPTTAGLNDSARAMTYEAPN